MKVRMILPVVLAVLASCTDLDPLKTEISELEQKIERLEKDCERFNTELNTLSLIVDVLQKEDFVTSVSPLKNASGETEGYMISFLKSGVVALYNGKPGKDGEDGADGAVGKDGADGADGADGKAPVISVRLDEDGKYYWTSDGKWILDENGRKVEVDIAGYSPKLKIEEDKWYISYDGGGSWQYLADYKGSAPGYVFSSVDLSDPSCVKLGLADGNVLALPVHASYAVELKVLSQTPLLPGDVLSLTYSVSNAEKVNVVVDDSDVHSSVVSQSSSAEGTVSITTLPTVSLSRQRAFLIFNVDGKDDWWMVSFDSEGNPVVSDIS